MVELATLPADRPLEEIEMSRDDFISLFPSLVRELISNLDLTARPSRTMAAQEKAEAIRSTLSCWTEDPDVLAVVPFYPRKAPSNRPRGDRGGLRALSC